ncbi:hypothetical protein GCM10022236_34610 [Microlunatus ginsengisoli]|uniref:Uncharacterized protein n=1 Tax=Microlunatus ginsengisoli TaxID=363863 RepID=A0ABP7ACU8_9ACTN
MINQETSSEEMPNSCAKLGSKATTRVCCSETVVPARESTAMIAPVGRRDAMLRILGTTPSPDLSGSQRAIAR